MRNALRILFMLTIVAFAVLPIVASGDDRGRKDDDLKANLRGVEEPPADLGHVLGDPAELLQDGGLQAAGQPRRDAQRGQRPVQRLGGVLLEADRSVGRHGHPLLASTVAQGGT